MARSPDGRPAPAPTCRPGVRSERTPAGSHPPRSGRRGCSAPPAQHVSRRVSWVGARPHRRLVLEPDRSPGPYAAVLHERVLDESGLTSAGAATQATRCGYEQSASNHTPSVRSPGRARSPVVEISAPIHPRRHRGGPCDEALPPATAHEAHRCRDTPGRRGSEPVARAAARTRRPSSASRPPSAYRARGVRHPTPRGPRTGDDVAERVAVTSG